MASIDIIIPFLNEAGSIKALCAMLDEMAVSLAARDLEAHLILVDDGSTDDSIFLFTDHSTVPATLIELSRNFGKEVAVLAGIDESKSDYALIMDADLQHSSAVALAMVDKILADTGIDAVFARRSDRAQSGRVAHYGASFFYRLINWGQRFQFPENAGDFRVMRRSVVGALKQLRDQRRFNKGLYAFAGFRQEPHDYMPDPRHAGDGKWSKLQMLVYSLSAFTSFSIVPLRILSLTGLAGALVSMAYGLKIILEVLVTGISVPGFPSVLVAVTFLGGLNLALLGLIGEYVWVGVMEGKKRPIYITRKVHDIKPKGKMAAHRRKTSKA